MRYSVKIVQLAGGALLVTALLAISGCGKAQETPEVQDTPQSGAADDPYRPGAPLPPNHPPMDGAMAGMPESAHPGEGNALDGMAGHPPEALQKSRDVEVVLPDSVKGKWSAVQIKVTGTDAAAGEYTVPVGGGMELQESGMKVVVDAFLPDYSSDFKKATSASDSLNNPAVLVRLLKGEEQLAKGWVFKNYPDFNTFRSDTLQLELQEAKPAGEGE